ncbi:hypothetical protein NP493_31g00000 [Ridgeia piscesae]|uniref:Uncharacterized protein n=1 Tax=Ridgeia piscesae TaxID=27915 RepID=A0AAD9PCQ2_RIDPI|nr:hypothetical protein NP493_31g00000 [Ridgeia piscesae]
MWRSVSVVSITTAIVEHLAGVEPVTAPRPVPRRVHAVCQITRVRRTVRVTSSRRHGTFPPAPRRCRHVRSVCRRRIELWEIYTACTFRHRRRRQHLRHRAALQVLLGKVERVRLLRDRRQLACATSLIRRLRLASGVRARTTGPVR